MKLLLRQSYSRRLLLENEIKELWHGCISNDCRVEKWRLLGVRTEGELQIVGLRPRQALGGGGSVVAPVLTHKKGVPRIGREAHLVS